MLRRISLLLTVVAAAAVLVVPATGQAAAKKKLVGTVGPGFTITLTMAGKKVKRLKAGKYTITVRDKSEMHNFHLKGKGVNKDSGVDDVGTSTWKVTLKKGKYTFVCDPHAESMKGSFRVT